MDPKPVHRVALLAAWACAALYCGTLRAGEEAKAAKPDAAADEALKPFDSPKRIDLEGQGLALGGVIAKLEAHFGWKLSLSAVDLAQYKVDLAVKGATCYEAIDAVRRAAKLGYADAQVADAKVLPVSFCELGEKGVCLATAKGPYLFRVTSVARQFTRQVAFAQAPEEVQANRIIMLSIVAEPGMKITGPKFEKAYAEGAGGARQDVQAWLHDFGIMAHVPGAAKTYAPNFSTSQDISGTLTIGGTLVAKIPQALERRVIEDLDAQTGKALDLGGGSLEFKKILESDHGVTLPFTAKGTAASLLATEEGGFGAFAMMALGGAADAGAGALEDQMPKDQPGLWFFDANRDRIQWNGRSLISSGTEGADWDVTFRMPVRPKGVIVQWVAKQAERSVTFEIAGVPEP
ncbi:MAG: hypothetical protein L6R28_23230 [Planctomycetes bacterium]|nr:hypothetical protein [Planctomycetota bacterium]